MKNLALAVVLSVVSLGARPAAALTFPGCNHSAIRKAALNITGKAQKAYYDSKKQAPPQASFTAAEKLYEPYLEPSVPGIEGPGSTYVRGFMNAHRFGAASGMTVIVKGNTDEFDLAVCAFDPNMPGKLDELKLLKEWRTGQFKIDRSNRTRHDARLRLEVGDGFNVLFVIPKGVVSKAAYTYQILSKP